jgi:2-deoxy-D-gluconate 3-dehydrogenase
MRPLEWQVALVTGASRVIGQAVAVRLAQLGADIGMVQRGEADETVAAVAALGRRSHVVRVDLVDAAAAQAGVMEVAESLGRLDVVVANAGTIIRQPALKLSLEDWRRTIDIDLTAVFAVSQAAARIFLDQGGGGRIVLIASVLSFQGGKDVCAYAAAKGGVGQLARALANEWAGLGIRVNAVAPGYVENEQTQPLRADPERFAQISSRIPAGRWARNEDIAGVVAFLVSPEADYVHGHVLAVDGGWLAR